MLFLEKNRKCPPVVDEEERCIQCDATLRGLRQITEQRGSHLSKKGEVAFIMTFSDICSNIRARKQGGGEVLARKKQRKAKTRRKPHGARNHKDMLFCDIFSIKEYALSLFNAANDTDYTDVEGMEIYTINEVVYITMHNDLAVCFHGFMELFEQQSTKSANIPLREFLYSADEYDKWLIRNKADLLNTKLVKIPAPKCFELYNGTENEPELSEKHLSDAFMHPSPGYEWTVYVINVNAGKNKKIMDRCMPLRAYAEFVQRVRDNNAAGMKLDDAVDEAVDYCIQNDLLADYFAENRGRVVKMMLTEYASKIHLKKIREEGRAEGKTEIVLEMLKDNQPLDFISRMTKYSKEKIAEIGRLHGVL